MDGALNLKLKLIYRIYKLSFPIISFLIEQPKDPRFATQPRIKYFKTSNGRVELVG